MILDVYWITFDFSFTWLQNRSAFELKNKSRSRVVEVQDLHSWLSYLLDNLFIVVGSSLFKQEVGIPMGTNCAVFIANLYLFTYEFDFMKRLINAWYFSKYVTQL
eukprot:c26920_g5_i1 orf=218-532(+)